MRSSSNYGWSFLKQNYKTPINPNIKGLIVPARVISIVLDSSHPRFTELGEWNALGAIEYDSAIKPNYNLSLYPVAYPLNANEKKYPLKNEIILLITTFSSAVELYEDNINIGGGQSKVYYLNSINIWNHPHQNGYSFNIGGGFSSKNKSYIESQVGGPITSENESQTLNLGKTFKEKSNIHPLLPFEGDIIYEGRWGNSIRLGSTVMASASITPNDWSTEGVGTDGDPIIIIRNGQGSPLVDPKTGNDITSQGYIPIIENVKTDISSIYLTSTQQIPIDVSSNSYVSYSTDEAPTTPSKYAGAQIILDSGRLVFNAYNDHILLSSIKSINLNAQESINIDTKKFVTQADKIFLGKETLATEPLLLGDTTAQILRDLVSSIKELATTLQSLQSAPVPPNSPAIFPSLLIPATKVLGVLTSLETQLGSSPDNCTITSKRNFTV